MDHDHFHLKGIESTKDAQPGYIGFIVSLVAVIIGAILTAVSWSPAEVTGNTFNPFPFILGITLMIAGLLFFMIFRITRRSGD